MAEEEKKEQAAEEPETAAEQENTSEKEEAAKDTAAEKPAKEKKPKSSGRNPFKSKKFKHGTLSVVFTVIFVAAIVLINVIYDLLRDRFDIKADLTENGLYTMGTELKEFTQLDSSRVHFIFTSEEETLENASYEVYMQTLELVRQLVASGGGRYDVSFVDLLKNPSFAEEHGVSKEGCLLVECEDTGRSKSFSIYNDFMRYVSSDGNSYSVSDAQMMTMYGYSFTDQTSIAEQELLSALVSVTKVDPVKAAISAGFGETENKALTELLEKNAYIVDTLDIDLAQEIPADYDILIMNSPTMDYSAEAITKIDEWLSNGGLYGKSLVYFACVTQAVSAPNLNAYLEEWGIRVGDSFVLQMDQNYAYAVSGYAYPLYQRAEIVADTNYYKAMNLGDNTSFRANGVRPVYKLWEEKSNYKNTTIIRTYGENCVIYPFDADESWDENKAEKGQFDVITEASKVRFDSSNKPVYSRIIAAGSDQLFTEYYLNATNYNNAEAAVGLFNTISGNTDKQITVTPKSFTATTYEIDSAQQTGIGLTFAVIIPVIIIVLGIVVWVRRRHL